MGVLVYILMLADVFSYILQALAYQGIFVVAAAIYMLSLRGATRERFVTTA